MKTILLMDIIIAGVGIYLAVEAVRMKMEGRINSLVVPEEEIKKCKDDAGYIRAIFPFMIFFAVVAFVVGIIGILADTKLISVGRIWTYIELLAFLLSLAVFAEGMRRAKEKFFGKM